MPTDEEIIKGLMKKSTESFSDFIECYGSLIKAIVNYHLADLPDYREECINDILFSVWNNIKSFDPQKNSFKNWIGAVSKYKTIDYKRKYYGRQKTYELHENICDNRDCFSEAEEEINSILACLNPEDRELFYRHYILGETIEKIAKSTGKTTGGLFNRLSRGRKKLRSILKEERFL